LILTQDKVDSRIKHGLLVVALTWFLFTFYQFIKSAFNIYKGTFWIELTDTSGVIGLGFRSVAGFIAVITVLFFVLRKDLSKSETMMSLRWIVLGEAVCFLSLFLVVFWGLDILITNGFNELGLTFFIGSTLPVLFESVLIPFALVMLFLALNPNKSMFNVVKWGLIAGTAYVFMVWFNNATGWIVAVFAQGFDYVLLYPANLFSFILTTVGLLLLSFYALFFTRKTIKGGNLESLDLKGVGLIVTCLGLYFLIVYVMWLVLGSVGGWSDWYAWFLGHNVELWMMSLSLVGIPLLFRKRT
jgi:hypothetical protein